MSDIEVKIANRYLLGRKLGEGSFGQVYEGFDLKERIPVAVKLAEEERSKNLRHEAKMFERLNLDNNRKFGVPYLKWSGIQDGYYFLVMDKLGKSLSDLLSRSNKKHFSLKTVCLLGIQGIYLLKYIHSLGLIHRDMKPNNFLMGKGRYKDRLYLIDFGLSKEYIDPKTKKHIDYIEHKNLTGTARYVSINTHLGIEQSRRDDLESLGYVLIHLAKGSLPWQGIKVEEKALRYKLIGDAKQKTKLQELCLGLPAEFSSYIRYCRDLGFTERPDYEFLKSLFVKMLDERGLEADGVYDWTG